MTKMGHKFPRPKKQHQLTKFDSEEGSPFWQRLNLDNQICLVAQKLHSSGFNLKNV